MDLRSGARGAFEFQKLKIRRVDGRACVCVQGRGEVVTLTKMKKIGMFKLKFDVLSLAQNTFSSRQKSNRARSYVILCF